MERKDYAQKFLDIKNEIVKEIKKLVPEDSAHKFNESFYVHFIEGEVATTEVCTAVEVWCGGMVVFIINDRTSIKNEVTIEGEDIFKYDPDSFLDILDHLRKDVREKKLKAIIDIVKRNGGEVKCLDRDFFIHNKEEVDRCKLERLRLDDGGSLIIENTFNGELYDDDGTSLSLDEIDLVLTAAKELTTKKFSIYVHGSYGRVFDDIEAETYEEALAIAQKMWDAQPLNREDSDGEDWEPWNG